MAASSQEISRGARLCAPTIVYLLETNRSTPFLLKAEYENMTMKPYLTQKENRRSAYKLLSTCYYLPDESILQTVVELEMALNSISPEAAAFASKMKAMPDLELLKIDFSNLFVGPFKLLAPPYGSVYLEGKREVMGASTIDARNQYVAAGLDFSRDVKEAPDHIAIELEFMYYLIFKEIEAVGQAKMKSAINYLEKQKTFLERHLGRWVVRFADNIEQHATTDFYKQLAQTTKVFVQQDFNHISEILLTKPWEVSQKQVI